MWIWLYGDFEMYHQMKLGLRREERGASFPVMWRLDDCSRLVRFRKALNLSRPETVTVTMDGRGYLMLDGGRLGSPAALTLPQGVHVLEAVVGNERGLPALFVEGETVYTDGTWTASCLDGREEQAGCWNLRDKRKMPSDFELPCVEIQPVSREGIAGRKGVLLDFGRETYSKLVLAHAVPGSTVYVTYGESREEALDREHAVLRDTVTVLKEQHILPARAFRFVHIVCDQPVGGVWALYEYLPLEQKAGFTCSEPLLNRIYQVSEYTLRLNSRLFFLDGIKRDGWVWSGDAFQSYLMDYYSFFDEDIIKRTILALRGKDPIPGHINTIVDYSFYWIMSISRNYQYTGDLAFVRRVYQRLVSLMDYCVGRADGEGLIQGLEGDWVFIDWADMEKDGALCAMQMLYCKALESAEYCSLLMEEKANAQRYHKLAVKVRRKIFDCYWNEELGAFVTAWRDGGPSSQVRRHANVFAIVFGFADEPLARRIQKTVLHNDQIPALTTPYFKFYELEARCMLGEQAAVCREIGAYWGGMLREGATTFWEEYNPGMTGAEHYAMYGQPFDKSLCHAWGASPLYLLGRYFLGVSPTKPGYEQFTVSPAPGGLASMEGKVPVKNGSVCVKWADGVLEVLTDRAGGTLHFGGRRYPLKAGEPLRIGG